MRRSPAPPPSSRLLALLFLDLDDFKPVNDALGHAAGDELLVAVAERLRAAVRKTDAVARLGGDEFAVLLTDVEHPDTAGALAGKLVDRIGQPYMLSGRRIEVGVSIGISVYPRDGATVDTLLSRRRRRDVRGKGARPPADTGSSTPARKRVPPPARARRLGRPVAPLGMRRDRESAPRLTRRRHSFGAGGCTWVFS